MHDANKNLKLSKPEQILPLQLCNVIRNVFKFSLKSNIDWISLLHDGVRFSTKALNPTSLQNLNCTTPVSLASEQTSKPIASYPSFIAAVFTSRGLVTSPDIF